MTIFTRKVSFFENEASFDRVSENKCTRTPNESMSNSAKHIFAQQLKKFHNQKQDFGLFSFSAIFQGVILKKKIKKYTAFQKGINI